MRRLTAFLLILVFSTLWITDSKAQTVEIFAGDVLNGAVQGTLLGGASMALANDNDFAYLRVGVGLGTLYGIGLGAYDVSYSGGREILVSGLFNDATNSSVIVLMDTFYGAALGSVVVTAIMLVANEPIVQGLQYGSGIGAWVGFGFGLFDAFALAERSKSPPSVLNSNDPITANGLVGISLDRNTSFGFVNPTLIRSMQSGQEGLSYKIQPSVDLLNFRVNF